MLRSFALTISFIVTLIVMFPIGWVLNAELQSQFKGDEDVMSQVWSGLVVWVSWILPLLAVEWWLDYERMRTSARRRSSARGRHDDLTADANAV